MNAIERKPVNPGALFWGLILIALGVFTLLDRMHIAHFRDLVRDWWPLIFIAIAVSKLIARNVWSAFWFFVIGAWFLAAQWQLWGLTYESSWPLILIAVGGAMIVRAITDAYRRRGPERPEEHHG